MQVSCTELTLNMKHNTIKSRCVCVGGNDIFKKKTSSFKMSFGPPHILFFLTDTVNANLKNARRINCAKLTMIVEKALALASQLAGHL